MGNITKVIGGTIIIVALAIGVDFGIDTFSSQHNSKQSIAQEETKNDNKTNISDNTVNMPQKSSNEYGKQNDDDSAPASNSVDANTTNTKTETSTKDLKLEDKEYSTPKYPGVSVSRVNSAMKGSTYTVHGKIIRLTSGKGHTFIVLKDLNNESTIKGVLFSNDSKKHPGYASQLQSSYKQGDIIILRGKIDIYKGELEIIIKSIK